MSEIEAVRAINGQGAWEPIILCIEYHIEHCVGRTLILVRSTHIHYNEGESMDETPSRGGIDLDTADLITIAGVSLGILVITGFLVGLLF